MKQALLPKVRVRSYSWTVKTVLCYQWGAHYWWLDTRTWAELKHRDQWRFFPAPRRGAALNELLSEFFPEKQA